MQVLDADGINAMMRIRFGDPRHRGSRIALALAVQEDGFAEASKNWNMKSKSFRFFSDGAVMT